MWWTSLLLVPLASAEPVEIALRPGDAEQPSYRMDRTEVSIGDFERFVSSGAYGTRENWSEEGWTWARAHEGGAGPERRASGRTPDHPVVAVSYFEAEAYCRSQGGSLPTEAQWERAVCAGGQDYPWGDDQSVDVAWFAGGKYGAIHGVETRPVASQSAALASPSGLLHGAGNVWEWTAGTTASGHATLRGGSFMNLPSYCTCQHREPTLATEARLSVGFRCSYP